MDSTKFNSLFSTESLMSLQGAALVTLIIPNVLTYLIGAAFLPYEKWVGFGIAMLLALFIASRSTEAGAMKWTIALLNGFLIFAAAAGLTDMLGGPPVSTVVPTEPGQIPFFHSWFR
jgi:hypothetical protein